MSSVSVDLNEIAPTAPEFEDAPPQRSRPPWLTWIAVAFLVVASAGAGWYMAGSHLAGDVDGDIPVVRADPAPIKSRPDDPGGMKVPDRDKLVYERLQGRSSPTWVEKMLPLPEKPRRLNEMTTAAGPATETAKPAVTETQTAAPAPPPPPPDAPGGARLQAQPESLLPPKTTAEPVQAKLDGPPKTIAELVTATVEEEATPAKPVPEMKSEPAAVERVQSVASKTVEANSDAAAKPTSEQATKPKPVTAEQAKPKATAEAKPMVVAKAEPEKAEPVKATAPPPPPPPAVAKPEVAATPAPVKKPQAETQVAAKTEAPKKTVPTTAKPVPAKAAASGYRIQIAAVRSAAAAEKEWSRLQKKHTDLLGGLNSMIEKADLGKKGIYYRIRAGMIAENTTAKDLCAALKQRKVGCIVVRRGS